MDRKQGVRYFDVISKAQKSYARFVEPVCRELELTRCELDIILFLYNNPEFCRAADIVEHRGIAKSHVSLGVSGLEQRGLLRRDSAPGDRRTAHLILTERGLAAGARARQVQDSYFDRIYAGVSEEELALWRTLTEKVWDNIENLND